MRPSTFARALPLLAVALCSAFVSNTALGRADARASVVIDGRHVPMHPPAILRAGSVFVPVRGVFENMGASVVYSSGRITAHGSRGEQIVMYVGQRSASINGSFVQLDTAPFIEGGSTFVPLRFVSEALGAQVSFDNGSKTVFIQSAQGQPTYQPQPQPLPPAQNQLSNLQPRPGSNVLSANPAISANFGYNVDPNSVSIALDGRDITYQAFVANNRFSVTPSFNLPNGSRTVSVTGTTVSGQSFSQNWSFYVRPDVNLTRNFVQIRSPGPGSTIIPAQFQVAGRTLPLAVVTVAASSAPSFGNYPGLKGPGFTQQTRADPLGNFSLNVALPNASAYVRVFVQSVAPDGSSAEATVTVPSR
jgi:hypothetical protein